MLLNWCDAVEAKCLQKWQLAKSREGLRPEGYPSRWRQIRRAQEKHVFLHYGRAPHGLLCVCKRWYQTDMAWYISDSSVFVDSAKPFDAVPRRFQDIRTRLGFQTRKGIPHNYEIWKPLKKKFRFIAGTRAPSGVRGRTHATEDEGPTRQPQHFLSRALVPMLRAVERALAEKDEERHVKEG